MSGLGVPRRLLLVAALVAFGCLTCAAIASAPGTITSLAGNGSAGNGADGNPAAGAAIDYPWGVTVDKRGDVIFAENYNDEVRLIAGFSCSSACPYGIATMTKGDLYTVSGNGNPGSTGDGNPASAADLDGPHGVATDSRGDLFIADAANNRVRVVAGATCSSSACPFGFASMTAGDIYTLAGNGTPGYSGSATPAASAELDDPAGVAVDSRGDVIVANSDEHLVELVAANSCSSACPLGLSAMTAGDIYTVAGDGIFGGDGAGGPAVDAQLAYPYGVALDTHGDLYISDSADDRVQLVAAYTCSSACPLALPSMETGHIYDVAGDSNYGYSGDGGPATSSNMYSPDGIAVDADGDLLIADNGNDVIRLVSNVTCSTGCPYGLHALTKGDIYTVAGSGADTFTGDGGPAIDAGISSPQDVAVDALGNLVIADTYNNAIREVNGGPVAAVTPVVSHLGQSHASWAEKKSSAKTPVGTTFSFTLSEKATVTLTFSVVKHGHDSSVGAETVKGVAGKNSVKFAGLVKGKHLPPGTYKLTLTASASGKTSNSSSLTFKIVS